MIASLLKNKDTFGHQVKLRVRNGKGSEQTSVCGGIFTFLIYGFVLAFFVMKSIKMSKSSLDIITSNEEILGAKELEMVNFTGMMPVLQIWMFDDDKEYLNYIDVNVSQVVAYDTI